MTHLVAVYGTLKEGYSNFDLMTDSGAKHLLTTVTKDKYVMYDGGFPMVNKPEPGMEATPVTVQVFEVDTLQRLDWLEGHPDHFCREEVEVEGSDVTPWMYFGPKNHGRSARVEDGNWVEWGIYGW